MSDEQPSDEQPSDDHGLSRRQFLWLGAAGAAGALLIGRTACYGPGSIDGAVLAKWEAHTLAAAAEALLPDEPGRWPADGPTPLEVAGNVDAYLRGMPRHMLLEIRGMFALIEQGTLIGCAARRFTRQPPARRLQILLNLRDRGGLFADAFEGIRVLCLVGYYQDDRTWGPLGYGGPLVRVAPPAPVVTPDAAGPYRPLVAEPGALPRGTL